MTSCAICAPMPDIGDLPVLMLTARGQKKDRETGRALRGESLHDQTVLQCRDAVAYGRANWLGAMTTPAARPLFLARQSYRRRRLMRCRAGAAGARGLLFFLVPLLWRRRAAERHGRGG